MYVTDYASELEVDGLIQKIAGQLTKLDAKLGDSASQPVGVECSLFESHR